MAPSFPLVGWRVRGWELERETGAADLIYWNMVLPGLAICCLLELPMGQEPELSHTEQLRSFHYSDVGAVASAALKAGSPLASSQQSAGSIGCPPLELSPLPGPSAT